MSEIIIGIHGMGNKPSAAKNSVAIVESVHMAEIISEFLNDTH